MLPHEFANWFRHGDSTDGANGYRALSTAPSASTDGIQIPIEFLDELSTLIITSSAGGAHSFTLKIWGYMPATYVDLSGTLTLISHAATNDLWANAGEIAISQSAGTQEATAHQLTGISCFTRLYAQVASAVGAPSVWTDFGFSRHAR